MADFCKQCAMEMFGEDSGDLAGLVSEEDAKLLFVAHVLCEGCGPIAVNRDGECQSRDCEKKHG